MNTHEIDIVKIGGRPIADPPAADLLWRSLAAARRRTVVVHGGGVQVDALMARLGEPVERRDGIRLTPAPHMPIVAAVLAGQVNQQLTAVLRAAGARSVGVSLASAGTLDAEPDPTIGGRVGRVTGGEASVLRTLLEAGCVPVVSSIGCDARGGLLNINADDAAAGLASALSAARLLLLTDVPGVLDAAGTVIPRLHTESIDSLIAAGTVTGGMTAKLRATGMLAARCHAEVRIASWSQAEAVLVAGELAGTLLSARPPAGGTV